MDTKVIIGLTALFSAASGAFVGFKVATKRAEEAFDGMLREELAAAAEIYKRVNKVGDFATPESAAETLVGEAATALVDYGTKLIPGEKVVITSDGITVPLDTLVEEKDEEPDPTPTAEEEEETYNAWDEAPEAFPITEEDYMSNDSAYDQVSVTYYEGDSVVAEHDKPLADVDRCVGIGNLATYGDENVIYVRNDRLRTDYEIAKSTGKFSHEVLGFEHSDEIFSRSRRRRVLADE